MLDIKNLQVRAEGKEILKGINLHVDAGQIHAIMGKLSVLAGVREFPVRVKCASLAWHTLKAALDREPIVSTE